MLDLMGEEHHLRRGLYRDLNMNRQLHHNLLNQQGRHVLCGPLFPAQKWADALSSGMWPTRVVWEVCAAWEGKGLEESLEVYFSEC